MGMLNSVICWSWPQPTPLHILTSPPWSTKAHYGICSIEHLVSSRLTKASRPSWPRISVSSNRFEQTSSRTLNRACLLAFQVDEPHDARSTADITQRILHSKEDTYQKSSHQGRLPISAVSF